VKSKRKNEVVIIAMTIGFLMWFSLLYFWKSGMGEIAGILIILGGGVMAVPSLYMGANSVEHYSENKYGNKSENGK